jgi:hypothetical protein
MFEIADVSDEECFFTIGVFLSLEEAVAAIEAKKEPWQLCESAMFSGEYAAMEIRKKKLGILDPLNNGDVIWRRQWRNEYDEDEDDNNWRIIGFPNNDYATSVSILTPATSTEQAK